MSQLIVEADLIDLIRELKSRVETLENRGELPIGVIIPAAKQNPSNSWLLCDGTAYSRTTYAGLYGVIGDTFGPGDGSTTFNVPDLKGRAPIGVDVAGSRVGEALALGATGGASTVALSVDEMPSHSHTGNTGATQPFVTLPGSGGGAFSRIYGDYLGGGSFNINIQFPTAGATSGSNAAYADNHTHTISAEGGGDQHNNMPPFMAIHFFIVAA